MDKTPFENAIESAMKHEDTDLVSEVRVFMQVFLSDERVKKNVEDEIADIWNVCGASTYSVGKAARNAILAMMEEVSEEAFSYNKIRKPNVFLQWKGTNACFDFNCECGALCHFDGCFAYYVKCPHCEAAYQMPFNLFPRRVNEFGGHEPILLEKDEGLPAQGKGSGK